MLNPNVNLTYLSKQEYTIYSKHLILEHIGINGQKRLKEAKILIIGVGGLGCPAMLYLIASGIGHIGIIDDDTINANNLNRQILYNLNDINYYKTHSAKRHLRNINTNCKIIIHNYKLIIENAIEIIQYYDIIIDASDNFKTRYTIDQICYILHKIHIYGAIQEFEGQVSVFNYKNNHQYSQMYDKKFKAIANNCNNNGVIGIITGHIGIIQATEAIKMILGIGKILNNKLLICNLLNLSFKMITIYHLKVNNQLKYNTKIDAQSYLKKIFFKSKFNY
uniref:Molybdopterin biosynthesis protein n=1 Tax=Haraldiophyllum bonnemaisonii TaxID=167977 RepID=A0A4D6WUH2_9FLOR|nr:Molybdopterin biosynthesis protein [Haraldiophyllum bonnemaisonii]